MLNYDDLQDLESLIEKDSSSRAKYEKILGKLRRQLNYKRIGRTDLAIELGYPNYRSLRTDIEKNMRCRYDLIEAGCVLEGKPADLKMNHATGKYESIERIPAPRYFTPLEASIIRKHLVYGIGSSEE